MAKSYGNGKAKTICILNKAICPDLTSKLVEKMKLARFSLSADGINDQNFCIDHLIAGLYQIVISGIGLK